MVFTILGVLCLLALVVAGITALRATDKSAAVYISIGVFGVLVINVFINVWTYVAPGDAVFATRFGQVVPNHYLESGIHLVDPFKDYTTSDIKALTINLSNDEADKAEGGSVVAVSANEIPMTVELTFTYSVNPQWLWWLHKKVGIDKYKTVLLLSSARATARDGVSSFSSTELMVTKRTQAEASLQSHFEQNVVEKLEKMGLQEGEARDVFVFLPVSLREVLPDPKVRNALDEAGADNVMLEREGFLLAAATKRAERGTQEGLRIKNLFAQLPIKRELAPAEVALILNSIAAIHGNEALMKAVEDGKVQWGMMPYGSATAPMWSSSQPAVK